MKRILDLIGAFFGLLIASPFIAIFAILIWMQDGKPPFYFASRAKKGGGEFLMVKLRSMVVNADKTGVASTSSSDMRITRVGHLVRKYKLDELTQLWNVLMGDMSLVGPRPNLQRDTQFYTAVERDLLSVRPGITDFSSIVFSDEGDILRDQSDPDIAYNQLIRPRKSALGLFYIQHQSALLDIKICLITIIAIVSKKIALTHLNKTLRSLGADCVLITMASRTSPLVPLPPPGGLNIITSKDGSPNT